jgi:hypothetical protein
VSRGLLGRAIAIAGIVAGLLAVGLPFASGARYVDDGTAVAFLLVLLCFASWLPAEIGRDLLGAAAGAAAFGFFLFLPATAAFDQLGLLESGAWLGLCTVLIPIGALVGWSAEREPGRARAARPLSGLGLPVTLAGLVLIVVGIWLEAVSDGATYWNNSSSGHAVGILMLLLVALSILLIAGPAFAPIPAIGNLDVLVVAATFGFVEFGLVASAFEDFGSMGAGAWVEACAGVLLVVGVLRLRGAAAPRAAPSATTAASGQ